MTEPGLSFHIHEDRTFTGQLNWIQQDFQLRFSGADELRHFDTFRNKFLSCVSCSPEQLEAFSDAFDLLDVWSWRNDYRPEDCGSVMDDGNGWKFRAEFGEKRCESAGFNAFPSFADPQTTSTSSTGRYGLLITSFCDIFRIRIPGYNC